MSNKEIKVNERPAQDPNRIAFNEAVEEGEFNDLEPGTWVFFRRGEFVGSGDSIDSICEKYPDEEHPGGFATQVGVQVPVIPLSSAAFLWG